MVIFLTGVGTRQLVKVLSARHSQESIVEASGKSPSWREAPSPSAALRELGVPVQVNAPEPNTWRELMQAIERPARNPHRNPGVRPVQRGIDRSVAGKGAEVTSVPVYSYELPEDLGPLREAVTLSRKSNAT